MSTAVRYYSRSGNANALAEAIAQAAGTQAISADASDAALDTPVDVLFVGGALYAYGIDSHLKDYLKTLRAGDAKQAAVFSTSWISKHAIELIKKALSEAGIPVADDVLYVRGKPGAAQLAEAAAFAKRFV